MKDFAAEIGRIKQVYNRAWEANWGEVPMTGEELDALARDMKLIVRPEMVVFAETADGVVAGFGLALPDINMALKDNRGGRRDPARALVPARPPFPHRPHPNPGARRAPRVQADGRGRRALPRAGVARAPSRLPAGRGGLGYSRTTR